MNAPPAVRRLATAERLGELCDVLDPRTAEGRARTWLVLFSLPGLVVLPFTVIFIVGGMLREAGLGLLLLGGYFGAAGRVLVRDILPGHGQVLYRFEGGLILVNRHVATTFPWDTIAEVRVSGVRRAISESVSWRFVIRRADGEQIEIGSEFPGVRELVEIASREVTESILPKYLSRIDAGGRVRIGPFTITGDGIACGGEQVKWPDVVDVQIGNGVVQVVRAGRRTNISATAGEVPNALAFAELARHLRQPAS